MKKIILKILKILKMWILMRKIQGKKNKKGVKKKK